MNTFEMTGEWGGSEIKEGANGWIKTTWSRIHGNITGRIVRIPFSPDHPKGQDMDGEWNDHTTNYMHLAERCQHDHVIRRGYTVR